MNERQQEITRELLRVLKNSDNRPMADAILHAGVNVRLHVNPSVAEYEDARDHADREGWIVGVRNQTTGAIRWSLTDAGQVALRDLS